MNYEKNARVLPLLKTDRRNDCGARFVKFNEGWAISVPKKDRTKWVVKEGLSIYVRRKNGQYINVTLKKKLKETDHGTYWSFKSQSGHQRVLNGP